MPEIVIFVGLPGVGKTTIRKKMLDMMSPEQRRQTFVLSPDDMIEKQAQECEATYQEIFSEKFGTYQKFALAGFAKAVSMGQNIICDQINGRLNHRAILLQETLHSKWEYRPIACHFMIPVTCTFADFQLRLSQSGKEIPQEVWQQMRRKFHPPYRAEGFDEIQRYSVDPRKD